MRIRLSLVLFVLALFAAVLGVTVISGHASNGALRQEDKQGDTWRVVQGHESINGTPQ